MSAVVKDDEDTHQEPGGNDGERERNPIGDVQRPDHETPEAQVRDQAVDELPDRVGIRRQRRHRERVGRIYDQRGLPGLATI